MVISDDVVPSEKTIQLDSVESIGADIGGNAVDDEVNVTVKLFNLWIVAILAAVFDRQRVKFENIEEHLFIGRCRRFHVDPDDSRFVLQQLREIRHCKVLLNPGNAFAINKNLHTSLLKEPQKG